MAHDDNLSGCEDQLANGDSVLDQPPVLTDVSFGLPFSTTSFKAIISIYLQRICSFCRKKCMRLNPYERHISHCKFRLQCKICLITFRNEDWLKIHLNDHLGNFKENLFECFDCKCRYKSMVDLWQHLRHH